MLILRKQSSFYTLKQTKFIGILPANDSFGVRETVVRRRNLVSDSWPQAGTLRERSRDLKTTNFASRRLPASGYADDLRWLLVERIVASRHFSKAPLLSRFLLHICGELLNDRQSEISEYQIGIQVFDRPQGYRTVEDNIVRNYARQLRKRLAEYFAEEGATEPLRLEIPLGGYIPVFTAGDEPLSGESEVPVAVMRPVLGPAKASALGSFPEAATSGRMGSIRFWAWLAAYTVALILITLGVSSLLRRLRHPIEPSHPLWAALFRAPLNTFIVPADCGFNIVEDLAQKKVGLADYLRAEYLSLPLPAMDSHSSSDLRTQEFTSFVDLEIVSSLSRLPEVNPQNLTLRFPRDLHVGDLKTANVILIGSIGSNPWTEMLQKNVNFRVLYRNQMEDAWIFNASPQPGEAASYTSHWNEPAHQTYALITFLPNLAGNGHILMIQGLDVAGTQAAAETLFRGDAIAPVLKKATLPDGKLRSFEVLLQSTSIQSNAANTQIIASRIF
jgi:hypothetical protein